ncbi:MAG: glycosyl transferase [Tenericutes bacterium HGW-Tenericutes-1]|nr:MAG: glycosyl transferase [Tenericutes bacterium HGW-Tenericutes-1]
MKLVQINSVFGRGSTGRIVNDIHKAAQNNGFESIVFYGRGKKVNDVNVIRINSKFSIYWHFLLSRLFDYHGLSSTFETKKMVNYIIKIQPDIIHLHNIHGYYLNYKVLFNYLKTFNGKVIWTLHDCWSYTGHCAYYTYSQCDKWKTVCNKCPQMMSYPKSYIDRSSINFKTKKKYFLGVSNLLIITPSIWLNHELDKSILSEYKRLVINNGIDTTIFHNTKSNLRKFHNIEDKYIILGVANVWDKRKGLEYFIELSNYLSDDEIIILIGLEKKQMRLLNSKIIALGKTDSPVQLAEYYSLANIFVNPTLEDNYPTTNLEALCCLTPVITFNTGGSPEMLDHNGVVLIENSVYEIYETIKKIRLNHVEFIFDNLIQYDKSYSISKYLNIYVEGEKNS